MAAPLIAGNDLRSMSKAAVETLTNLEAIAVNQDPLGIQGKIVWTDGTVSLWAEKPLIRREPAVLVFNQGRHPAQKRIAWTEIGIDAAAACYVRNLWTHETIRACDRRLHRQCRTRRAWPSSGSRRKTISRSRPSSSPIPTSYRSGRPAPARRSSTGSMTVTNKGSVELALWRVGEGLPGWLSVKVAEKRQEPDLHQHGLHGRLETRPLSRRRPGR